MPSDLLVTGISQLVTPAGGQGAARGADMRRLDIVADAALAISDGRIDWVGPRSQWNGSARKTVDVGQRALVPGLVDPHTHCIWAGDRLADFEARSMGVPYERILADGGGIRSTIRQTAGRSADDLVSLALPRVNALLRSGATTIEVKSGYGLAPGVEVEMLKAIHLLDQQAAATIVPTLLVHVPPIDPSERAGYLDDFSGWVLDAAHELGYVRAVDVFIEKEAWTPEEAHRIFVAAGKRGIPARAHVDQFHAIGGVEMAVEFGARSVDHLEASGPTQIAAIAGSGTVGVLLPGVTLHLGIPAAPGRALVDAGAAVAVGTDLNPGSSPLFSSQMAMALAVRLNGLSPAEALTAATANAAHVLGFPDRGRLHRSQRADFLVLDSADWRDIVYTMGGAPVARIFIAGQEVTP
jgi:imidazolonepropionase